MAAPPTPTNASSIAAVAGNAISSSSSSGFISVDEASVYEAFNLLPHVQTLLSAVYSDLQPSQQSTASSSSSSIGATNPRKAVDQLMEAMARASALVAQLPGVDAPHATQVITSVVYEK
jgi:hypothetical protein